MRFYLTVSAIQTLWTLVKASHIAQIQKEASLFVPICQTQQPIGNLRILIDQVTLIAMTGFRSAEDRASQADIRLLPINRLLR